MALGICLGPYGVKGQIKVRSYSGETAHFPRLSGEMVELRKDSKSRNIRVVEGGVHGPQGLIRVEGIQTPEAVHPLIGWEIWADRSFGAPLRAGEYYISDLVGCSLVFQGEVRARVVSVWESTASDMLEVEDGEGKRFQVPFQGPYIGQVDLPGKTLELLVEWILA